MRFWILLLLIFPTFVLADMQIKDGKVTARLNSESLNQVIDQFRNQTSIKLYVDDTIMSQIVSAEFSDLTVAAAVKKILEGTGVNYVVLSGESGEAERIFIGTNKAPGAPPRRLDSRPTGAPSGRGVVTPVNPLPAPATPPPQVEPDPQRRPIAPSVEVPTGGGYVPGGPQKPPAQETEKPENEQDQDEE